MKSKTRKPGHRDSVGALLVAPDLNGLYGQARVLRDTILRRLAAIGYKIDDKSLPEARSCVAEIAAKIGPPADKRRKARVQRATPLRLVADSEKLG